MEINLYTRTLSKGRKSMYLQITGLGAPIRENLKGMWLYDKPKGPLEKQHNRETEELADNIIAKRRLELQASANGFQSKSKQQIDFLKYFEAWKDKYSKADVAKVRASLAALKEFLKQENIIHLPGSRVDKLLCVDFGEYLKEKFGTETAKSYMLKFKNVLNRAFDEGIVPINSASFKVKFPIDHNRIGKQLLDTNEIEKLMSAECGNDMVRRAFIVSLNTGFDFATVSNLYGWMVDKNRLVFDRSKTGTQNSFPLNKAALAAIGKITDPEAKIFYLPTWNGSVKTLRSWAKRAGITKQITWHTARHSFGTNHANEYGTNVEVIKELLGHKDIRMTMKYVKVKDQRKREAVEKMDK